MHVIDLEGNEYPLQATATNEYELNGNQSLSFRIIPSKVNRLFISDITEMWQVVDHDDITHKIIYLKKQGEGSTLSVEVKAIPKIFDDLDSQRIYERYDRHMTANFCFNLIFEGSGYNFILNGTFESQEWEGFGEGDTRLSMFQNALNRYKAEFRVVGNTIYVENLIGRDTGFMYRYRLNASNIVQENDAGAYHTYARGYGDYGDGAGGEDWQQAKLIREYTSPLAKVPGIGIREGPPIKNGNITTKETMDEQLKILVDESLKISVTATIHDLRKQGYEMAQPEKGDRVFLIDERIGLNAEVRVIDMRLVRNWKKEVVGLDLTLGSPGLVKRHQANLKTAISNITNLLEGKIKLPFSVLDTAVAEATKSLLRMETQLTIAENGTLMAIDKSDPNNVVVFNAAGLGVSDDGGATFGNALTGLGLNVDYVYAGTMLADRIAGGILSSLNGNTEFNLNSGLLQMKNTEFQLGGGANINFLDSGNKMFYQRNDPSGSRNTASGVGFGTSINNRYSYVYMGVSDGSRPYANDGSNYSGFIANSRYRPGADSIGNSVVGSRFQVRDRAVSFNRGFTFDMQESVGIFYPMNTGTESYSLGHSGNRWHEIYGTLVGTSAHNSKMNIEDIDGKQAYDYFTQMKVKSFFYKDDDITNKFNKKASPIIEQLDPVLENIYKATDSALDINSNIFLLASAFKYFVQQTNPRLEVLENGTEPTTTETA